MIDTKQLERIINSTETDKNIVHPAVVKIGKSPDMLSIDTISINTHVDSARLWLRMEWNITNRIGAEFILSSFNSYRLKWFNQIIRRFEYHAKDTGIKFFLDVDSFEFGVRKEGDSHKLEWEIILCASVMVDVFTEEYIAFLNSVKTV